MISQPNYLVFVLIAHLLAKVLRNAIRIAGGRKEEEGKENKKAKLDMQHPVSVAVVVIVTSLQVSGTLEREGGGRGLEGRGTGGRILSRNPDEQLS